MASCTAATLTIEQDVANAVVRGSADIKFTEFDRNTNMGYDIWFQLMGDDTGYDSDLEAPDDLLTSPAKKRFFVRADGRETATLDWEPADIPWEDLDEDTWWADDEELRLLVTVEPYNPVTSTRESNVVILDEINP